MRVRAGGAFDLVGGHVLAPAADAVVESAFEEEVSSGIGSHAVAGAQPAVALFGSGCHGGFGLLEAASEGASPPEVEDQLARFARRNRAILLVDDRVALEWSADRPGRCVAEVERAKGTAVACPIALPESQNTRKRMLF